MGAVIVLAVFTPCFIENLERLLSGYPTEACIKYFAAMNPIAELYCFLMGGVLLISIMNNKQGAYVLSLLCLMIISSVSWCPYEVLAVVMVLVAVTFDSLIKSKKITKIISALSSMSFTLYLIHPVIIRNGYAVWKMTGIDSKYLYAIFLYISSIGVAALLYHFVIKRIQ